MIRCIMRVLFIACFLFVVHSSEVFVAVTEKDNGDSSDQTFVAPDVVGNESPEQQAFVAPAKEPATEQAFVAPDLVKEQAFVAPDTIRETTTSQETRCRWGEHCTEEQEFENTENVSQQTTTLPFVPPNKKPLPMDDEELLLMIPHKPPEGFVLSARVYTDPIDKFAHFDADTSITLPYWECGAVGSTTSPLQVKHAYFRHALGTSTSSQNWQGTEYGPHPHLLIPLAPLQVTVSSGETRVFEAGDVILLEDVVSGGHTMRAVEGRGEHLVALIVTLPQHYHHVGKDRVSLSNTKQSVSPCPNDVQPYLDNGWNAKRNRQVAFGAVGAAVSTSLALFLTKVAPLWLSVGIGGTCFVVGGTAATVKCGEAVIEQVQTLLEKKRLEQYPKKENEEEDEDVDEMPPLENEEEAI